MECVIKDEPIRTASIKAFSAWEIQRIGLNVYRDIEQTKYSHGYDLSLEEAKFLVCQLMNAIQNFENTEATIQQYFDNIEEGE